MRQSPARALGTVLVTSVVGVAALLAQSGQRPRDPAAETYRNICAGCHGATLSGGRAPTLLDDTWRFGGDDASVTQSILDGRPGTEMAPFRGALTDAEVESLVAYIRNQSKLAATSAARAQSPVGADGAQRARDVPLRGRRRRLVHAVGPRLPARWTTAHHRALRRAANRRWRAPAAADRRSPGGVDRSRTAASSTSRSIPSTGATAGSTCRTPSRRPATPSMTAIIRGRVKDGRWVDQQTLYRATSPDLFSTQGSHFGSRFLFDRDGHLFYSIGDRGHEDDAQDLSRPAGKIHRINPDGTTPRDNPFVGRAGALASIWSLGHRNPQGLAFHPVTGKMWATEHGPTGGDELNRIERGHNYGWPLVTSGKMFPARPSPATPVDTTGFDAPITSWSPSIGPGGITFYTGDRFPNWKHHLFVTGLAGEALRRLETDGDRVVHEEVVFKGFGRVRDVITGPDGLLYVALNVPGVRLSDTTPGLVVRLVPAAEDQVQP